MKPKEYKEEHKPLNKNLIHRNADDWARQNIELLFEDVYNWVEQSIETIDFSDPITKKMCKDLNLLWDNKKIFLLFLMQFEDGKPNFRTDLFDPVTAVNNAIVGLHPSKIKSFDIEFMNILIGHVEKIAHRINSLGGDSDPEQIITRVKSLFWGL
jgi:hypothetical protein